jgi:hypothetical protein
MKNDLVFCRLQDSIKHFDDAPGTLSVNLILSSGEVRNLTGSVTHIKDALSELNDTRGFLETLKTVIVHCDLPTPDDKRRQ